MVLFIKEVLLSQFVLNNYGTTSGVGDFSPINIEICLLEGCGLQVLDERENK